MSICWTKQIWRNIALHHLFTYITYITIIHATSVQSIIEYIVTAAYLLEKIHNYNINFKTITFWSKYENIIYNNASSSDDDGFFFLQTHLLSSQDVNWWSGVDYCDVYISCLDSHSDGTHSLQRIHCWESDAVLHFSKPFP